jgi:hypothetical protein
MRWRIHHDADPVRPGAFCAPRRFVDGAAEHRGSLVAVPVAASQAA